MTSFRSHDSCRSISGYPKDTGGRFPAPLRFAAAIRPRYPNTLRSGLLGGPQLGGFDMWFILLPIAIFASMSALGLAPAWLPVETDENRAPYSDF